MVESWLICRSRCKAKGEKEKKSKGQTNFLLNQDANARQKLPDTLVVLRSSLRSSYKGVYTNAKNKRSKSSSLQKYITRPRLPRKLYTVGSWADIRSSHFGRKLSRRWRVHCRSRAAFDPLLPSGNRRHRLLHRGCPKQSQ